MVGRPSETPGGCGRGAGLPGVTGAGTTYGLHRPVGDEVVRGAVRDHDLDHVARAHVDRRTVLGRRA